ncbi:Por secretion system C-terminal sorting domain-containing protein [Flavobacterium resistens]|uniref:Por secretion system C-terminal sorting domain-containing protein n=1 Tax=Flavobacterium resistens TaxID=443612 RepID=A0A521E5X9_9FLAO|nr:T9SS sorting signal type C domain-containing protein [Flavobacterium resistens]MRX69163.1 T9SS sorting signal type C domain-containing protein [Flavobacterium resistens]SMO79346.1 Por secretion system C-terminal sorting domain-containing protein [Flavobacterium resistens]
MIRKLLLSFLFFLLSLFTFGKNTSALNIPTIRANYFSDKISIVAGTITSTSTGGNWNSASSWVGGVVPTATDDVVIASGATVTSTGTINAKTLTISGKLIVSGTVTLNSITQLTINGLLTFADNTSSIYLPSGTAVKVNSPGKVDDSVGCSNNVAIYIGSTKIAACKGNGGGAVYDFDAFNSSGGTLNAIANSNSPVCQNGTINLIGSYSGSSGTKTSGGSAGVNYSWSMKAPDGTTTTSNTQNYNLTASQTGNYTAILTCTTYYGNDLYTSTSTITVAVSQAFSLTSVTAVKCTASSTPIVTLNSTASSLPTGTYTVTYNTTNPSATAKTATMTVSAAGSGTFTTTDLTTASSSTITITNLASGSCSNTISSGNTATLQTPPSPQSGYLAYVAPACFNSPITINLTGTIVGAVVRWEKRLSPSTTWTTIANTTNSYTETPATAGTWEYRVMVGDVNCGIVYTGVLQVEIRPELTVTLNSTNSPVCKDGVSSTLTYSATTGSPNGYALVFDSAAKSAGFGDQGGSFTAGTGTITINVPYGVAVGTYNATVRVFIYSTSCTSVTYPVTVTVSAQISSVSIASTTTQNFCTTGNLLTVTESGGTITSRQWGKRSASGGTITPISGATSTTYTPTTASLGVGTWYVVCTSTNGGCTVTSNEVIVNAGNIVSTASSTPTTCIGVNMTSITHTTINASGINSSGITGLPAGVTAIWNNNTITISGTPTATGTFTYSIPLTGCSNAVNATGTIKVNPTNTITLTSATGTDAQNICKGSAITTIRYTTTGATGTNVTGLPAGVTGTWASNVLNITGTPTTTTGGTFNYTVTLLNGCGNVTATGTITVAVPNRGQVHGGKHICLGDDSPQLYMSTFSGTIVKWQYSDDPAESSGSWIDIPNTANLTTYQPAKLTALRTFRTVVQNGACPAETAIQTRIDVDTRPTFTVSPSATSCPNTDVTYTTQSGQGNYIWTVPGTLGTDYSITSGGIGTSNSTVTLKWLTAGSKTVTVTYSNACSNNPAASSTTMINEYSVSGPQSSSVCINNQMNSITHTIKGFNGIGTGSYNLPSGLTVSYDNTSKLLTISGTPTSQGTFNYTIPLTASGCTITGEAKGTITVNGLPAAPSASVTTQPTCSGTKGTITITATAGYTYSINGTDYYNQSVFSSLDPAFYTVTAKNASGCISTGTLLQVNSPASKTWTGATSTDWNTATNWSPSGIPTSSDCVIIPSGVTKSPVISDTSIDSNAYTLTVNDKASLVVEASNTLKVYGAVKVLSSATTSGSLLFKNNSSLIQTDTSPSINSGNISYQRTSLPIRQADYVYWSTPVQNQTLREVSPLTDPSKLYAYDGSQWVFTPNWTIMTVGKGYIIRGPENYSNTNRQSYAATFIGTPNNGTLTGEAVLANKFYLVGNPYPSALDANKFILENKNILKGTLYFWTHNTPVVLGGAYQYNTDDYASYNVTGGVKTAAPTGTVSGNNNDKPSGQIGAGQAFFVGTNGAGTIAFTNLMRSGGNDNSQFFKPGNTSKTASTEKHRVWLNMTNEGGAFKQLLVGYVEGATNNVETIYDGATFDGNKYLDFYSVNGSSKLVIQGRALPFLDTDIVPLGYKTTIAGEFTIAIDEADGNLATQKIYLEDKTTGTINDLTQSNYTFTTTAGTFADRFVLRYTNKSLGTGDFENIENGVLISVKDKTIKVLSSKENLKEISVYDISGRVLYNKTKVNSTELQISNLQSSNQVLIVKVTLDNDFTISKKVIFN